MKKKTIQVIVVAIIFFIGISIGAAGSSSKASSNAPTPTPEVITKTNTVTKIQPADTTDWKALKSIDDQGFTIEAQTQATESKAWGVASQSMTDAYNQDDSAMALDTAQLKVLTDQINTENSQLNSLADKRSVIIKKLGL